MDLLKLNGISLFGRHGVLPEENKLGQRFVASLALEMDLEPAGLADDTAMTVDYAQVIKVVAAVVQGPRHRLIEAVAEQIAGRILEAFPPVDAVTVELLKPNPPVAVEFAGVSVVIRRTRK